MKRFVLACTAVVALTLAACSDPKASLEADIKSTLSNQMTVSEVNLTPDASGNYSGYAKGKTAAGLTATRNCTAGKAGDEFKWSCVPGIDQDTIKSVEDTIKAGLAEKGTVTSVTLKKGADEDHMTGDAVVETEAGTATAKCTATREPLKTGTSFAWACE